jgi:protoporphyrinogen oxidase
MKQGRAIIIGAGPAGLTAAIELQRRTGIQPIVVEASYEIGGISRTILYKRNRMDVGGRRFFSKSDRVMRWWLDLLPVETDPGERNQLRYRGKKRDVPTIVMLERQRKSRIYFMRRFFDYPIRLNADTLKKMGLLRTFRAGVSYMRSTMSPKREEKSLEDFLINRFGRQLYLTFFKSYTEKVWGVPRHQISAVWGAQRIKGLSLKNVAVHFFKTTFGATQSDGLAQKRTETSLIEKFLYPKLGRLYGFHRHLFGVARLHAPKAGPGRVSIPSFVFLSSPTQRWQRAVRHILPATHVQYLRLLKA